MSSDHALDPACQSSSRTTTGCDHRMYTTHFGTETDPLIVPSLEPERIIGVTDPDDENLVGAACAGCKGTSLSRNLAVPFRSVLQVRHSHAGLCSC